MNDDARNHEREDKFPAFQPNMKIIEMSNNHFLPHKIKQNLQYAHKTVISVPACSTG
jgi:hypothetical protein